ncbi:MAG: stalk domain-containing protein [Clostridia bacterium]
MKKFLTILSTTALTVSLGTAASASGIADSVIKAAADDTAVNIIYNGQLLTYTDAVPENINDRIMLPFRAVLESMGAEVDYDDSSRLVTASRNDTTIKFTLEDDTIYVTKDGQNSEIKLDVPMTIKNDRTLVPVRFISNALGMQVGWDGNCQTVFVVDADSYIDTLTKDAPNLMTLTEKNTASYNTSLLDLLFNINAKNPSDSETTNMSVGLKLNSQTADKISSLSGTVNADLSGSGISVAPAKDAVLDIILSDGKLYFKTDLVKQLFDNTNSTNPKIQLIANAISSEQWFCIDVNTLIDTAFKDFPENIKNIYKQLFSGDLTGLNNSSFPELINKMLVCDGDATLQSAIQTDVMMDTYKVMDKYITVTDNSVEIKLDNDFLREVLTISGVPEETIPQILDMLSLNMIVSENYTENEADSQMAMELSVNSEGYIFNISLDMTQLSKNVENLTPAQIPENAIDLTNLL